MAFAASQVRQALGSKGQLQPLWGPTLYHRDDLPFPVEETADVFTPFKNKVDSCGKAAAL